MPWLYWHPLSRRQILYLLRASFDDRLWDTLGWEIDWDAGRAREVEQVVEALKEVVALNASFLLPGWRIDWKRQRSRPGRKATLDNPDPANPRIDKQIDATTIVENFHALRGAIKTELKQIGSVKLGRAVHPATRERLCAVAAHALKKSGIYWSGAQRFVYPMPDSDTYVLVGKDGEEIGPYHAAGYRWDTQVLRRAVDRTFDNPRLKRDRVPAVLAREVLGVLLNVPETRIRDMIECHQRSRRSTR